jgi:hypothetical protein
MEPENRPYVDADTEPGDAGTEEFADGVPGSGDSAKPGHPAKTTDDQGVAEGSPADSFISDPDAVDATSE